MLITIVAYAKQLGVSHTLVRKWVAQQRVAVQKIGRDYLIDDGTPRPGRAAPGTLTAAQRAAWRKRRKVSATPQAAQAAQAPPTTSPSIWGVERTAERAGRAVTSPVKVRRKAPR